jgi:hypothetical protein
MLGLRVAPSEAVKPDVPAPGAPGVEVWRHTDETLIAFGGSRGQEHWLQLVNVGLFVFGDESEVVTVFPDEGVSQAVLDDGFRRAIVPLALQVLGRDVLHASAVLAPAGVVAFCALSETGKSTIAYALDRRGYDVWADDAVAFRIGDGPVTAVPLAFTLRLRRPTTDFYGVGDDTSELVEPTTSAELRAVCILERADGDGGAAVERLTGAGAFAAVLAHAYCFSLANAERKERMAAAYLELVERVAVYRVRLATGLEKLPPLLDELERTVGFSEAIR